jgi:hypothetical protein
MRSRRAALAWLPPVCSRTWGSTSRSNSRWTSVYRSRESGPSRWRENASASRYPLGGGAAARAGCGHGKDTDQLVDQERACWHRQALDWLRQDLTWLGWALDRGGAQAAVLVWPMMQHWLADVDLAGVRGRNALAGLSGEERRDWERLWSDVGALLRRAGSPG